MSAIARPGLRRATVWAAAMLSIAASTAAFSDDDDRAERAELRGALERGDVLSIERVVTIATQQVAGHVIKVELDQSKRRGRGEEGSGQLVYEVDVLTDRGGVRELELDARSGEVLESRDDDD